MTLYDVLGTAPSASLEALHAAYRDRARALHPDLQGGRSTEQRRAAEDAMRELNAAWSVLSDPARRTDYDRSLVPAPTRPPVIEPTIPDDDVAFESPGVARLARAIPIVVVLAVLGGIFVFTAFAIHGPDEAPDRRDATVGDCVRVQGGHVADIVACGGPNDGEVVHVIDRDEPCPTGEQRVDGWDGSHAMCLAGG